MIQSNLALPKVSIIVRSMPGRLGALRMALDSIRSQSYINIQVIVVLDGGKGVTAIDEITEYPFELDIILCPRVGRSWAGNQGLERCTGELIGFLDDDDTLYPKHIELLVSALMSDPKAKAAYSIANEIPSYIQSYSPFQVQDKRAFVRFRGPFSREDIWVRSVFPIQSVLFRRRLYEQFGGFDESLEMLEDWDLWIRYSLGGRFCFVPSITSAYRAPAGTKQAIDRLRAMASQIEKIRKRQDTLFLTIDSATVSKLIHARIQAFASCRLLGSRGGYGLSSSLREREVVRYIESHEGHQISIGTLISALSAPIFLRPHCRILILFETMIRKLLLGRALI